MQQLKARDRNEAVLLIEARAANLVELDYEDGALDVLELSNLGQKYRVGVLHRAQEPIIVESIWSLLRGLEAEKNTFRQRHLYCCFDLASCNAEELQRAEMRAALLGDFIFQHDSLVSPFDCYLGGVIRWLDSRCLPAAWA